MDRSGNPEGISQRLVPAPRTLALHSSGHAPTRRAARLHPGARPSPCSAEFLPAQPSMRAPHAGCHAPALIAPTTWPAVVPQVPAPLAPPMLDSRWHVPGGCAPSLRLPPEPPARTHESSLASPGGVPRHPAPFVAANSCRCARPLHPARLLATHRVPCRAPPPLPMCSHPQRRRAAERAAAPWCPLDHSSMQACYAAFVVVRGHPVPHSLRRAGGVSSGSEALVGEAVCYVRLPAQERAATHPGECRSPRWCGYWLESAESRA